MASRSSSRQQRVRPASALFDRKSLVKEVRRMNEQAARERLRKQQAKAERLQELRDEVEAARNVVVSLRNEKHTAAFKAAKERLAALRLGLRDEEEAQEAAETLQTTIVALHTTVQQDNERRTREWSSFQAKLETSKREQRMKQHPILSHKKTWNFSTDASKIIPRAFMPLGPSHPSELDAPGTRFSYTRPKVPWKAVPEGLSFGKPPEAPLHARRRRRHTVGGVAQHGKSGHGHGKSNKKKQQHRKPTMDEIAGIYRDKGKDKPQWKAADAVSRVFSTFAYNRPATAHEKAMARKMTTPDRAMFQPAMTGVTPWRPTSRISKVFNPIVHTVPETDD